MYVHNGGGLQASLLLCWHVLYFIKCMAACMRMRESHCRVVVCLPLQIFPSLRRGRGERMKRVTAWGGAQLVQRPNRATAPV